MLVVRTSNDQVIQVLNHTGITVSPNSLRSVMKQFADQRRKEKLKAEMVWVYDDVNIIRRVRQVRKGMNSTLGQEPRFTLEQLDLLLQLRTNVQLLELTGLLPTAYNTLLQPPFNIPTPAPTSDTTNITRDNSHTNSYNILNPDTPPPDNTYTDNTTKAQYANLVLFSYPTSTKKQRTTAATTTTTTEASNMAVQAVLNRPPPPAYQHNTYHPN
ncbi:Hypp6744 [Branchiostoma lanceolatum]|uniref:Hypp6744 protein n=1 Tax=Branchiostoma lanceolatum TaxID=7740 RepID=A0A8J9YVI1_BRALA|nr:Hypp6744 [Branchiostoma lanceolatum]